jgi:NAD(P)-dependent dehydrogenase (short-subunit alcohol dehydrogenase family)
MRASFIPDGEHRQGLSDPSIIPIIDPAPGGFHEPEVGMADAAIMAGKTILITGGTSGIGEVAALELARQGARIVIVGRSREKAEATVAMIQKESGNQAVEYLLADLSSQADIRRLAEEVKEQCPRLDVLVNNAGAMIAPRRESADGIEMTFALNHLGYFLLTNLLLDTLKASAPSRVVNVASDAHRMVSGINFDDIEGKKSYKPFRAYSQSKLANILFTRELARRLEGSGVTANCLHPGFVATNFTAGKAWIFWVFQQAARIFAITPEQGAKTTIYLASSPEVEGVSGRYFVKCKEARPTRAALDDDAARRLWKVSEQMV